MRCMSGAVPTFYKEEAPSFNALVSPQTKSKNSAPPGSLSVSQCFQSLYLAKTDISGRHRGPILFLSNYRDRLFGGVSQ